MTENVMSISNQYFNWTKTLFRICFQKLISYMSKGRLRDEEQDLCVRLMCLVRARYKVVLTYYKHSIIKRKEKKKKLF